MQDELRQLRRMLFGRKSERFIPSDPSQLKLDFEDVAELKEERGIPSCKGRPPIRNRRHASNDRSKNVSGVSFRSIWNAVTRSSNPMNSLRRANVSARRSPNCWNTIPGCSISDV